MLLCYALPRKHSNHFYDETSLYTPFSSSSIRRESMFKTSCFENTVKICFVFSGLQTMKKKNFDASSIASFYGRLSSVRLWIESSVDSTKTNDVNKCDKLKHWLRTSLIVSFTFWDVIMNLPDGAKESRCSLQRLMHPIFAMKVCSSFHSLARSLARHKLDAHRMCLFRSWMESIARCALTHNIFNVERKRILNIIVCGSIASCCDVTIEMLRTSWPVGLSICSPSAERMCRK